MDSITRMSLLKKYLVKHESLFVDLLTINYTEFLPLLDETSEAGEEIRQLIQACEEYKRYKNKE